MRIVFFGTSDVGLPILEALAKEHEIIQVVTSPDAFVGRKQELRATPIADLANELQIPAQKPEQVKNNSQFLDFLKELNADIFIIVSYGKILPLELLEIPPLKTINVHFSLLPKYRGAAPIQYALLNGETTSGTTIFILDEKVDHGPVLVKKELGIEAEDTFSTLAKKLSNLSAELLIDLLPKYAAGEITPEEQNHDDATFTKLIKKEYGRIDWAKPAQEIFNMWRAYTPWPGIWTTWKNENFKILQLKVIESPTDDNISETIKCGNDTYLLLQEVQPAGKKPMTLKDFMNGAKDFKMEDLV